MSNNELVTAYVEGRISRRTLIRRLVAAGVSMGAAVSYAHLLGPERAGAVPIEQCSPEYPTVAMTILSAKLSRVRADERIQIRADYRDPNQGSAETRIEFTVTTRRNGQMLVIGSRSLQISEGKASVVRIGLDNVRPLRNRNRARITVEARDIGEGSALCGPQSSVITTSKVLRG